MTQDAAPDGPPPVVLIVDDEQEIRTLFADILRRHWREDAVLLTAPDGEQAEQVLRDRAVDVVLVDLLMPRLDGWALMDWARGERLDVEWVILSGRGTFDDAVRAVQFGAFSFLPKPLDDPQTLVVTVRNALQRRRLRLERDRLVGELERSNEKLREQVTQLEEALRLLSRQHETIEQDLHRAELIQRALLPTVPPPMDGYGVDAIYRPSRDVGGDLYDVLRIDDRHVVLYVADAAGHGVSAAMLAVVFKHRLGITEGRTHRPLAPQTVLSRVNAHLRWECSGPGLFVTAAYVLLDLRSGEMTIASAGHPPLVLRRADGQTEMIYHTGPALGLTADARFSQARTRLGRGDRLLLYTDGLGDALAEGDEPAADRLADALADGPQDGWEMLHDLLERTRGDEGEQQGDDITAVLLTAGQSASSLDNGAVTDGDAGPALPIGGQVLAGCDRNGWTVSVAGRGSWTHSPAFHERCLALLDAGREITLDFSLCRHLDSTFLGTLQEVVARADRRGVAVRIQGLLPAVCELLDELGMSRVLRHAVGDVRPLPTKMSPVTSGLQTDEARSRMLAAHRALAELSEANRQEFAHLIRHLEDDLRRQENAGDDEAS